MAEQPVVVVSGYASIDEVYAASRLAGAAQTGVLSGPVRPAARHGGCGPNTARVLARLGVPTAVVTWLGDDQEGRAFIRSLVNDGVSTKGVEVGHGASPRSLLIYDAEDDAACYFHPSGSAGQVIGPSIRQLAGAAQWLAITVGPPEVSAAVLDARGGSTRMAWGVKGDPLAFPPELCRRLLQADVIALNQHELDFIGRMISLRDPTPQALLELGAGGIVLTRGSAGYTVVTGDGATDGNVQPVDVPDLTGAGDAFLAGLLAGLVDGDDLVAAARRAAHVARDYLLEKATQSLEVAR